ncbi:MAG: SpaA isopeptide-forming pilin-related protein, partial [Clostridiales bacterium]|nr:SpaA isopeptide-forming pilin-related protein [Clostridiales bacterium]
FTVNPKDENFRNYLNNNSLRLNIRNSQMENPADQSGNAGFAADGQLVINEQYKSIVKLFKYDADEEAGKAGIKGTEFTLYHANVNGNTWTPGEVVNDAYYIGDTRTLSTTGVFTTGDDGKLSIEIRNKGYYILRETKAKEGYKLDENVPEFKFQLVDKATAQENVKGIYGYDSMNTLAVDATGVPNTRIMGSVTLSKVDGATKEPLNEIEYTLTRTAPTGKSDSSFLLYEPVTVITGKTYTAEKVTDEETNTEKWTFKVSDGEPGVIKVEGLNWGTYKLQENTELSGYVKSDKEYEFEVKSTDRDVTVHDDDVDVVTNAKNKITLHKLGTVDGGNPKNLAGAVFEIHEGSGDACGDKCSKVSFYESDTAPIGQTVTRVTSGTDGTVTIYGLPTDTSSDNPNTYHLVETTAPKGYRIAPPVDFTIDRHGKVKVSGSEETEVSMTDKPIKLYIEKIGEDKQTKLAGAQFELTDICDDGCSRRLANDASSETVVTGTDGKVMIPVERVIAGHTYQLKEIKAPDGYECTAVITFTVDTDGKAEIKQTSGGYVNNTGSPDTSIKTAELNMDGTTFTISNEKIGLSLVKEDYDDANIKLAGVKFTLSPESGSSFVESYTNSHSGEFDGDVYNLNPTDNNGELTIPKELLMHDNSYILTETDIGQNNTYRFADNDKDRQITFMVNKDGTLTITKPNDMFSLADGDGTKLVVKNQKIALTVTKIDQATANALSGVTLKLSRLDENNEWRPVSQIGVTDVDGTWTTSDVSSQIFKGNGFTPGTYMVEEIYTPVGYNSIAGPLVFVISAAGKVTNAAIGSYDESGVAYSLSGITEGTWVDKNFKISNPTDGKAGEIKLDITNAAYTDLQVTKKDPDGNPISGAEFMLEYKDSDNSWKKIKLSDGKAEIENHVLAVGDDNSAKMSTASGGLVKFKGLPDGDYRLTETKTTQGYNLLSAPIEIHIDRNGMTYNALYGDAQTVALSMEDGTNTLKMTVVNKKGSALPKTGKTTPNLPKPVLPLVAFIETLMLSLYGRRRRKKGVNGHDR